jgi:hypothetical protein
MTLRCFSSRKSWGLHWLYVRHKPVLLHQTLDSIRATNHDLNSKQDYLLENLCCKRLENLNDPTKVMNLKHQYLHGSQIY